MSELRSSVEVRPSSSHVMRSNILLSTFQKYGYDLQSPSSSPTSGCASTADILQMVEKENQQNAFHLACKKGHLDILKALAKLPKAKQLVLQTDKHGNSPLHFAVANNSCALEMTRLLLSLNSTLVSLANKRGQTPLTTHLITTKTDNPQLTTLLLTNTTTDDRAQILNELNDGGGTYLHMAIGRELLQIACALVSAGASINIPNSQGSMVSDLIPRKTLVKLSLHMKPNTQSPPAHVVKSVCKLCQTSKSLLDPLRDCKLCGRAICKKCSSKATEVYKTVKQQPQPKDQTGRFCQTCCTVLKLRDQKQQDRNRLTDMLHGCSHH